MRFIAWNMALSAWLLISSFAFTQSEESLALSALMAVLMGTFAFASPGLPGLRLVNALLALILGWAALLMPGLSGIARVNNALVAAAVFALSIIPGRSTGAEPASGP
jgi:hypothetical protein